MSATHVVTGAASGIGREVALRLRDRGARLLLPVRSHQRVEELTPVFPEAEIVVVDLADPGAVLAAPECPEVASVTHAAGVVELGRVGDLSTEDWQRQLAVNLVAPAVLTRRLLPGLRAARGTVVFVNSGAGLRANPDWAAYAASKFGLRALADALREEEREQGVRVTSVFPGRTATPMQRKVHDQEGQQYDEARWIRPETVAEAILSAIDAPEDAVIPEITIRPR
ncbi:SDR family oxidoreductase [Nocardioides insulae]|uniref:SDR family oxidoreductase n=1 Tax=Nocardioides insulae TaxID=394734 RepID=UPI000420421F|nr:SDR family oxidoreductase [Nocardioides insulae]